MITLKIEDNKLVLYSRYIPELVTICRRHGNWNGKNWIFELDKLNEVVDDLTKVFYVDIDTTLYPYLGVSEKDKFCNVSYSTDELKNVPKLNIQPWEHQIQAYFFIKKNNGGIIAYPPGTGKTIVPIMLAKENDSMIYVCPASAKVQVQREFKKIGNIDSTIIHPGKNRNYNVPGVIIVNYDLFRKDYNKIPKKDIIVLDEAHYIKSPKMKTKSGRGPTRSGAVLEYIERTKPMVVELTGSPIIRNLEDTVMLVKALDSRTNYYAWKRTFAFTDKFNNIVAFKSSVRSYINRLKKYIIYKSKEQLIDLPLKQVIHVPIEMYDDERKIYDEAIENNKVDFNQLFEDDRTKLETAFINLRQLAITPKILGKDIKKSAKLDWIEDFVKDEMEDYLIIYSTFIGALDIIQEKVSKYRNVYRIDGSVKDTERQNQIDEWKKSGGIMLLSDAGAIALNLQFCHQMILVNTPITFEKFSQLIGRIDRGGQKSKVQIWILESVNTVDERVWDIIEFERLHSFNILDDRNALLSIVIGGNIDEEQNCRDSSEPNL